MDQSEKTKAFKAELKEVLKKYNAEVWIDLDGDTHGVSSELVIEIDRKEVMRLDELAESDL